MTRKYETYTKVEMYVDPYGKLYIMDNGVLTELRLHVDGVGYAFSGNVVGGKEDDYGE